MLAAWMEFYENACYHAGSNSGISKAKMDRPQVNHSSYTITVTMLPGALEDAEVQASSEPAPTYLISEWAVLCASATPVSCPVLPYANLRNFLSCSSPVVSVLISGQSNHSPPVALCTGQEFSM